ncbi:Na+/H+ antiporter NhaA [Sphingosinicella sp. BN140058]|uniref:Na+/H+ antiporter NhaA n=1 Tax=Sphingosinicella sp. BN140058 TaxID=1892855 RepID=UPI0010108BC6|nr:Na+/H+ antiporter NhaA [Sphingosinicella sp. BN140058]QAY77526.1 Na+/H+ antiporter NhaA [Sphingosinicella sp. BN140058]
MSAHDPARAERNAGLLLMAAAALALIIANSPFASLYDQLLHAELGPLSVHYWIADALMAVFFLLVGLEVKREWYDGQLATPAARRLPMLAAASGMAVPAFVYLLVSGFDPQLSRGWAIPAATDIAFALGVIALIGGRVPASIKLLLVTIAVIDDIGAVAIIALFYTADLNTAALAASAGLVAVMAAMNMFGVRRLGPYLIGFVFLWVAVQQSGIHATIAGVLAALTVPLGRGEAYSPLKRLEHAIHPWVMFGIVPIFGFASAGVTVAGFDALFSPLPLAVAFGLLVGKQLGVFSAIWIADRTGLAPKPPHLRWLHIYGAALLCGIGFTMSLFIGELAFAEPAFIASAKIGTLAGSAAAGLLGFLLLRFAGPMPSTAHDVAEAEEVFGEDFDRDPRVCAEEDRHPPARPSRDDRR